jgi:hypothetical protein
MSAQSTRDHIANKSLVSLMFACGPFCSWDGSIASNVQRNAGPAGPNFADRVCACHHRNMILMEAEAGLDRECWVRIIAEYTPTLEKLMVQVWILQFICAMLAYAFVRAIRREQNPPDEELQKPMEKWSGKDPPAILSVEAIMDPVAGVKAIYDFLNSIHWAAREEAHFLMASWYFETTVLFSSAANFFVLAYQSHALPPKVHMQSVLEIAVSALLTAVSLCVVSFAKCVRDVGDFCDAAADL